jgi:ABC-type dipeptide/oligopeptide/nickel transport system permease component
MKLAIATRLGYAVLVIFLASAVTFFALHASPGSVVDSVLNVSTTPHAEIVAWERSHGLLDPLAVQYWHFLSGLLTGNLGTSLVSNEPVTTIIANSIGYTGILAGSAFLLVFGLGIPLGALAAIYRGSLFDRVVRTGSSLLLAIPNFVLGVVLILIFGVHLQVLPVAGAGSFSNLVLPSGSPGRLSSSRSQPTSPGRCEPVASPTGASSGGTCSVTRSGRCCPLASSRSGACSLTPFSWRCCSAGLASAPRW